MSDPNAVTTAIERAEDAFEYRGHGRPDFETGVNKDTDWKTQLTKGCGGLVPTEQKATAMCELAESIHGYVVDQIRDDGVCVCP
jgi:hypothetical protein